MEGKHMGTWGDIRSIGAVKRIGVGLLDSANRNIKLPIKFVLIKGQIFKYKYILYDIFILKMIDQLYEVQI